MEFMMKSKNAALPLKLISDQCFDIIAHFPADCDKRSLRKQIVEASMLSQQLDKLLRKRAYIQDWQETMALQLIPKTMSSESMCKTISITSEDIDKLHNTLQKVSYDYVMIFEGMKVTDACMRPFDMRDDLVIVNFYKHICYVKELVFRIENNLEILKKSVCDKSTTKYSRNRARLQRRNA